MVKLPVLFDEWICVCARRRFVRRRMGWCTHVLHSYCGPLITIAVGIGFMLVGAVPVAITYAIDAQGSATIIGAGFVGFGVLVVLPGLAWCLVRRVSAIRCCHFEQHGFHQTDDDFVVDDERAVVTSAGIQKHLATLSGSVFVIIEPHRCTNHSGPIMMKEHVLSISV